MFYFRNGNILVQTFKAHGAVLLTQSDKQNVFFQRIFLRENIKTN